MTGKTVIFRHIQEKFEMILPVDEIRLDKISASSTTESEPQSKTVPLSVPKIFHIFSQTIENLSDENLAFICNGKIYPVTGDVLEVNVSLTRVIYLVFLNPFLYDNLIMFDEITLDEVSYGAANDWLNVLGPEEFSSHQETIHLLSAFKATVAEKEAINTPPVAAAGGAAANDENNVHPAARALEPIRRLLQFLHWRLLLRMFLLYLLFFHNREMKDEKRYVIIGMMVIAYILQTGILALLLGRFRGNPAADDNNNNHRGAGNPLQPNAPPGDNPFLENIRQLLTGGLQIPRNAGLFNDFLSIFLSFFASLFPAWEVRVEPEPPQPVLPPNPAVDQNQPEEKQPEEQNEEQKQD